MLKMSLQYYTYLTNIVNKYYGFVKLDFSRFFQISLILLLLMFKIIFFDHEHFLVFFDYFENSIIYESEKCEHFKLLFILYANITLFNLITNHHSEK